VTHVISGIDHAELTARAAEPPEEITTSPEVRRERRIFYAVSALGLVALGAAALVLLRRRLGARVWWIRVGVCAPVLVLSALVNWDLLAVFCVVAALEAWERARPGWAGTWIGLGTAAKLYPVLLPPAVVVLALRQRRPGRAVLAVVTATATWVAVNAPSYLLHPDCWREFWALNSDRVADFGSLWMAARMLGHGVGPDRINLVYAAVMVVACLVVLVVGLRARVAPNLAALALVLVTVFLVANKVYSPQYTLWLLPLVVLATRRVWLVALWALAELVYFVEIWFFIAGFTTPDDGVDKVYVLAIVVRVAAQLLVCAVVVRDAMARREAAPTVGVPVSP